MSKGQDGLVRIQLVIRHEQVSRSAFNLHSNHRSIRQAFQQLQHLRKLVVQAEHSHDTAPNQTRGALLS